MFPRDRVMVSLTKYSIAFTEDESTEALRSKLAEFYARRTITHRPILPIDCANAILFLAGDQSAKTTGHVSRWTGNDPKLSAVTCQIPRSIPAPPRQTPNPNQNKSTQGRRGPGWDVDLGLDSVGIGSWEWLELGIGYWD